MGDGVNKGANLARVIIVMGSLVIVALVGVIVALVMVLTRGDKQPEQEETPPQRMTVVNEDNINDVVDEMLSEPLVEPGYYEVTQNMEWNFTDGQSPSYNSYVENVASNTNDVYFDVVLSATGETIYESPVIPRGQYLNNVTLARDLDAGNYDCVLTYHLIDERQNTLSTLNLSMSIIVES